MSSAPPLDDLEREIERTLRTKADQLDVPTDPFAPVDDPRPLAAATPARPRRRRALVAAAAATAMVAGVGVAGVWLDRLPERPAPGAVTMSVAPPAGGIAGLLPATPLGWALADVDAGGDPVDGSSAVWQLFGPAGDPPLGRAALVGTTAAGSRVVGEETHEIHGHPAAVLERQDPLAPEGSLHVTWIGDGLAHDAIVTGMTEEEAVEVLNSLVPKADAATGFEAQPATLGEIASAVEEPGYQLSASYTGPGGETVRVSSMSESGRDELLHRMAGERVDRGWTLRGTYDDADNRWVSRQRDDGWTLQASGVLSPAADPGVLDQLIDTAMPVTTDDLVEIGLRHPVIDTASVADWQVEVHGTSSGALAACLTRAADEPVCTQADSTYGIYTAASALVDGSWVVFVITDGDEPAAVRTSPTLHADGTATGDIEDLDGPTQAADGQVAQVVTVPADVDAIDVIVETGDDVGFGTAYTRPTG